MSCYGRRLRLVDAEDAHRGKERAEAFEVVAVTRDRDPSARCGEGHHDRVHRGRAAYLRDGFTCCARDGDWERRTLELVEERRALVVRDGRLTDLPRQRAVRCRPAASRSAVGTPLATPVAPQRWALSCVSDAPLAKTR